MGDQQSEEVVVSSEMVLDDILGDDIIGETSDTEGQGRKEKKRSISENKAEPEVRSRSNSYASDISSTASVPGKSKAKRVKSVKWERLNARYFVIKSNNMDNVEISMEKGVWATPRRNEDMLVEAFRQTQHVILIYSVRESGHFQGLARMMSMPYPNQGDVQWIVGHTPALRMLPNLFKVQWITKTPLDFVSTSHLKNRWNEWKPVKISRDGQEIEPKVGAQLCQMWGDCEDPCSMAPATPSPAPQASSARAAPEAEENILPSSVKTTYSTYKDEDYVPPEPMSDGEEPLAGLSHRMKERLGGSRRDDEERERKRRRREEFRRAERPETKMSKYRMDLLQKNAASAASSSRSHERGERSHRRPESSRRHSPPPRHSSPPRRERRHRSRSPAEKTSAKDILLNGSYLDYVREYESKHSRLAALLQDPALRQDIFKAAAVAAGTGRSSRKSRREEQHHLDERSHAALVDEFLSTHSRR